MASRLSFAGFDSSDVLESTQGSDSPGGLSILKKKTDGDHVFKVPQKSAFGLDTLAIQKKKENEEKSSTTARE